MRLIVKPHKIIIDKDKLVNEKEIDISKCTFEFDEEITDDFVKEALFTFKGTTYKQLINNNECTFPQEVLAEKGQVEIGVVAYKVENEVEIKRYNPSPAYFNTLLGSLKENIENTEPITPTDKEQIESQIASKQDKLVSGTNIKTINHESLLGEGNIIITGGGGSLDYDDLTNKPSINNVEITGNKSLEDLGIQPEGNYALTEDVPTELSELTDDATHRLVTDTEKTTWNNKSNFSGSYNDLTEKPTLFSGDYDDLTNKPSIPNKISDLTDDSDFLESTDLKTINGENLVGSGDITINTGGKFNFYEWDGNYEGNEEMLQEVYDKINNGEFVIVYRNNYSSWSNVTMSNIVNRPMYFGVKQKNSSSKTFMYSIPTNNFENVNSGDNWSSDVYLYITRIYFIETNGIVTGINSMDQSIKIPQIFQSLKSYGSSTSGNYYYALSTQNTKAYTPTSDYHPTTKKYVDDKVNEAIGDINTVLASLTTVEEGE